MSLVTKVINSINVTTGKSSYLARLECSGSTNLVNFIEIILYNSSQSLL